MARDHRNVTELTGEMVCWSQGTILNEPAGQVAQVIVEYAVERIVKAWDDTSIDPHHSIEDILQCLFHPYFHNNQCGSSVAKLSPGDVGIDHDRLLASNSRGPATHDGEDASM